MSPVVIAALASFGIDAPRLDADGFPLPPGAVARYGSSRFRSGDPIDRLTYSPDGQFIASEWGSTTRVWDVATGRLLLRVDGSRDFGNLIGFGPNGVLVVSWQGERKPVRVRVRRGTLLDPLRLEPEYDESQPRPVYVRRYEIRTGRMLTSARIAARDDRIVLSPDGRRVAYRTAEGNGVAVADALSGRELWQQGADRYDGPGAFSPDGRHLAWLQRLGREYRVSSFDVATGKPGQPFTTDHDPHIHRVQFSPNGRWLVVVSPWILEVWDTTTRTRAYAPEEGEAAFSGFFGPDQILHGRACAGLVIADLKDHKRTLVANAVGSGPWVVAAGDRKTFAVSTGCSFQICDAMTGKPLPGSVSPDDAPSLSGFTSRNRVLLNSRDREERPWSVEWDPFTGRTKEWLRLPDENTAQLATAPRVNRDERVWVTCDTDRAGTVTEIICWDARTVVWRQPQPFNSFPDWRPLRGERLHTVRAAGRLSGAVFTSDFRRFVAEEGYGNCLAVFDGVTGRRRYRLPVVGVVGQVPYQLSPDDRTVALGPANGTLIVVELATGLIRSIFRHGGLVYGVAFSPDGKWLAGQSTDAPILVWDVRGELSPPVGPPDVDALAAAWAQLDSDDAREAFEAIRLLAAFPDRSLPFLRQQPTPDGLRAVRAVEAVEWIATPEAVKLLEAWAGSTPDAQLSIEAKAVLARLKGR